MKYRVNFTSREWEIIAEEFIFDDYYAGRYDETERLGLIREAWRDSLPIYLNDVGVFSPERILSRVDGIVTNENIFSIFDEDNLTFAEMLDAIYERRNEIVKIAPGDENPYE